MDWLYWLLLIAFWTIVFFVLYVPLPPDIADRKKLIFVEFGLRIVNEYLADVVELLFGPVVRNHLLRIIMAGAFKIPRKHPDYVKVSWDEFNGVPVRVYIPQNRTSKGGIIFIHGGGWSTMRAEYYDDVMYSFVRRCGVAMFSIDYRLAPEHPFPAPLDDCVNATKALLNEKYKEYDLDASKISIIGDSAGGNLAAVTCLRLREFSMENTLNCQILIYPVIHMFAFRCPSYTAYYAHYNGSSLLSPVSMARWSLFYLGEKGTRDQVHQLLNNHHISGKLLSLPEFAEQIPEHHLNLDEIEIHEKRTDDKLTSVFMERATNPDICPILAKSLRELPPAMVLTAGYDILRDEGILYAKRLQTEGVATNWKHYPTGYHGVFNMPTSTVKRDMMNDVVQFLVDYL